MTKDASDILKDRYLTTPERKISYLEEIVADLSRQFAKARATIDAREKHIGELLIEIEDYINKAETAEADNGRLRERLHDAYEIYAGMEGFEPITAPEGYCLSIIKKMAQATKIATEEG
jgi:chromosome segregation ATPase